MPNASEVRVLSKELGEENTPHVGRLDVDFSMSGGCTSGRRVG